jgi:hypothetical protein
MSIQSRDIPATFCTGHRNITHIAAVAVMETVFMRLDRLDRKAPQMFQHVHYSRSKRKIECMWGRGEERETILTASVA